jgi:hypothetical protein
VERVVLRDAAQRREVTPGARRILDANPELKNALPPEVREKLGEPLAAEQGGAKSNAPVTWRGPIDCPSTATARSTSRNWARCTWRAR